MEKSSNEKAWIRSWVREQRKKVTPSVKQQWDERLCCQFFRLFDQDGSLPARSRMFVYLYMDFRNEAGTGRILQEFWRRGIRTAVPRTEGKEIFFYEIWEEGQLCPGYQGIPEPKEGLARAEDKPALVIVPGMAFDRKCFRIGYGGGFYDRFFAREPEHPRWALAYDFQVMDTVPHDCWDQPADLLITPKQFWKRTENSLGQEHIMEITNGNLHAVIG